MTLSPPDRSDANTQDLLVDFLKSFDGMKYRAKISAMPPSGSRSLVVDGLDIVAYDVGIGVEILQHPKQILKIFDAALVEVLSIENSRYAEKYHNEMHVRIRNGQEKISLRQLNFSYVGKLVTVAGITLRSSSIKSLVMNAAFRCLPDGHLNMMSQDLGNGTKMKRPFQCQDCDSMRFQLDREKSLLSDVQTITIQELPEDLPPGEIPRSFEVLLIGDLVNSARPGDRIYLTGIMEAEGGSGRELSQILENKLFGNYVDIIGRNLEDSKISAEEEEHFKSFAHMPGAYDRLIRSFSPKICGHEPAKEALLLALAGSPQNMLPDGSSMRGDISILLLGDPGTGKSEMVKFAHRVASRSVFTVGRGSSAAGLSAAVVKDKGGSMMLEAGAAVLADLGILCIDEFGDLRIEDMAALKELMELQTVSIAKGGITANLNARTSILATMNPVDGKYDPYKNIVDNISVVPIALLTRFDLIFILHDAMREDEIDAIGAHIGFLRENLTFPEAPPVDFDFLKRYLMFSKQFKPKLTKEAYSLLFGAYKKLKREADPNGLSVTPRWLEGLVRLTLARARILLREFATEEDAMAATALLNSMLNSVAVDTTTKKVDVGVLYNKPVSEKGLREAALHTFRELSGESKDPVEDKAFYDEMEKLGKFSRDQAEKVFQDMWKSGVIFEVRTHFFKKA